MWVDAVCTCNVLLSYRIYQFIGMAGRGDGPVFGDLFAHYDNIKGDIQLEY